MLIHQAQLTHITPAKLLLLNDGRIGRTVYSDVYEWAEFSTEQQARECERKLLNVVQYFKNKIDNDE